MSSAAESLLQALEQEAAVGCLKGTCIHRVKRPERLNIGFGNLNRRVENAPLDRFRTGRRRQRPFIAIEAAVLRQKTVRIERGLQPCFPLAFGGSAHDFGKSVVLPACGHEHADHRQPTLG